MNLALWIIAGLLATIFLLSGATIVPDLVYLAMAGFVAWGRFGPESFTG